jgi:hypothetical protein
MSPTDDHGPARGGVGDLVAARLGRRPQDKLEAAVVLEAWAGVRPRLALDVAGEAVDRTHGRPARSVGNPRESQARDKAVVAEGLSLLIAVVAVALWTLPFGRALGTGVWDDAVRMALPVTLAGQWMLRSRYLGRPNGLPALRRDWAGAICLLAVTWSAAVLQGERGIVAFLLIVTWVGGTVLVRRGWGLVYVVLLVVVAVEVNLSVDPLTTLAAAAAATLALAMVVVASAGSTSDPAGRSNRALAAGIMGAGIGALLVLDTSIGWGSGGVLPALALVPSTAGSFWGGYHLWRFYDEVPRALTGVPVAEADRVTLRGPAIGVLGGAFGRLVGTTVVLSAVAVLAATYVADTPTAQGSVTRGAMVDRSPVAPALVEGGLAGDVAMSLSAPDAAGQESGSAGRTALLVGFGLIALATLLISLLQSLGFPSWALFTLACAAAAEIAMSFWESAPFDGIALVTGAAVAVLVAIPPVISLFLRPGRVLATILWIS